MVSNINVTNSKEKLVLRASLTGEFTRQRVQIMWLFQRAFSHVRHNSFDLVNLYVVLDMPAFVGSHNTDHRPADILNVYIPNTPSGLLPSAKATAQDIL